MKTVFPWKNWWDNYEDIHDGNSLRKERKQSMSVVHQCMSSLLLFTMCQNIDSFIVHVKETIQTSFDILQWSIA